MALTHGALSEEEVHVDPSLGTSGLRMFQGWGSQSKEVTAYGTPKSGPSMHLAYLRWIR